MTCLADGLRKLATRNSRLRTSGILPSQTIAQISIAQYNIQQVEVKHPSTQTKTKKNSEKAILGFHHIKQQLRNSFTQLKPFLTEPKHWFC